MFHNLLLFLNTSTANERSRYVIVGFQTYKQNSQVTNPSVFDHCDLQTIYVMLNNVKYPEVEYNLSFPNMQFSRAYEDECEFSNKFYGMNEMIARCNISPSDYRDLYPLFVFDVSRQSSDESSSAVVDLTVKARFNTTVLPNTNAFAVVISDYTNIETGNIKIYKSLFSAIRETKHCWRYLESRDGKIDDRFKIEILTLKSLSLQLSLATRKF